VCPSFGAQIIDLGTLGGEWSAAYGMNDSDQVVGLLQTTTGDMHAFLYSHGQMTDLYPLQGFVDEPMGINNSGRIAASVAATDGIIYPAVYDHGSITIPGSFGGVNPDGLSGIATAINEFDQVVGFSYLPNGEWHAFLYEKGEMHDLACPSNEHRACYSYAIEINNHGQVVGGTGYEHAFLYSNGAMTQIEPSDAWGGRAYGINNKGQIAGYYHRGDVAYGFQYRKGTFVDFSAVNSPYTTGFAINELGQVVGGAYVRECPICDYRPHAILFQNGVVTDLNTLLPHGSEWELVWAFKINNHGHIAGEALINGHTHAVLIKP
jgi:probable HAF family extracellular repeat protein